MRIKTEIPLTLSLISNLVSNTSAPQIEINAITTNSRLCEKNDLFIALKGEKYDGADFINDAKRKGAYIISERGGDLTVKNSYSALLKIAEYYKTTVSPEHTIAITGSCGKTTVKDFTHKILSHSIPTHKTRENYNNSVGLAHTILSTPASARAITCELGMNHAGEIRELSRALHPDVSVITNIGTAHIGNLGSREAIADAKLEIEEGMSGGKTVFFKEETLLKKAKNPYFVSLSDKNADMYARVISRTKENSRIIIKTKDDEFEIISPLSSEHTINSLLLSVAAATVIGLSPAEIIKPASEIDNNILRQKYMSVGHIKIYDDSYNSSPDAVITDLRMLNEREECFSALIGDMLELGDKSEELHELVGRECAKNKAVKLYAFGEFAKSIEKGALSEGMDKKNIFINTDLSHPEITAFQIKESYDNERILIKASHSVNISRITRILEKGGY